MAGATTSMGVAMLAAGRVTPAPAPTSAPAAGMSSCPTVMTSRGPRTRGCPAVVASRGPRMRTTATTGMAPSPYPNDVWDTRDGLCYGRRRAMTRPDDIDCHRCRGWRSRRRSSSILGCARRTRRCVPLGTFARPGGPP